LLQAPATAAISVESKTNLIFSLYLSRTNSFCCIVFVVRSGYLHHSCIQTKSIFMDLIGINGRFKHRFDGYWYTSFLFLLKQICFVLLQLIYIFLNNGSILVDWSFACCCFSKILVDCCCWCAFV
jgi:hypothetical protein